MKLNARQKAFCEYYVASGNATDAAKKAGYSETYSKTRTNVLLRNVEVCRYVKELQKKVQTSRIMTAVERREFLTEFIKSGNKKGADVLKAIDILNKMDGEYTEKLQLSGEVRTKNPFTELTTEELRALAGGKDG